MLFPEFLHIAPQGTIKGAGIILSTSEPFLCANILQLRTSADVAAKLAQYQDHTAKQVPGYNIVITFGGTMLKSHLRTEQINNTLQAIAQFFLTEKITPNAGYYKKYLTT